jgi:carbamoyl-phosphate synthase large subunit
MPKRTDLKSILVIGSGPIVIGQACEFDYSGTQACKALRDEGYRVVLVNSNPATIMTDPEIAGRVYIEPLTVEFIERLIEKERPDALLPTVGGQTALNLAVELGGAGVLEKYGVELIGASVEVIARAEDRERFKAAMDEAGLPMPRGGFARSPAEAEEIVRGTGFPAIIRPAYTLGGRGGGIAYNIEEFRTLAVRGLEASMIGEILVEESVIGWKEFELEVIRDLADNVVVICSIENIDPMGVHTGDSITVAPAQTLTDREYQQMRDWAKRVIRTIGVETGGSNIQFAVNPEDGRMLVIEMNPRVSRSSALASKATGYPIAKVAAKLAVGYTLDELPNDITRTTPASFEPTIDYVVVKVPRWEFNKFPNSEPVLTTQMKSIGEAMAIGRTFKEALQKGLRSTETGRAGLCGGKTDDSDLSSLRRNLIQPNPDRLFHIRSALRNGWNVIDVQRLTRIDPWFILQINDLVQMESGLEGQTLSSIPAGLLREAKRCGFSDQQIAVLLKTTEAEVRSRRIALGLKPVFKRVDTCSAEFEAGTPYLYSTYEDEDEAAPGACRKVIILGGGPNRIGQAIEFDYLCCQASGALGEMGIQSIMVNCNPETVSTDYDTSDRLYFEPLTLEDVLNVVELEKPEGLVLQFGGQTPLKLAKSLTAAGVPILGTQPEGIDVAEDRGRFGALAHDLGMRIPTWDTAGSAGEAVGVAGRLGYPLVVRPSYVLGGLAMAIVYNDEELRHYVRLATDINPDSPVFLDRFLEDAFEVDVDALCDGRTTVVAGILQHIEEAGIHSGDSTMVFPSYKVEKRFLEEIREAVPGLASALGVVGLMNVQFAIKDGELYVLEVNPRASRTVPFISKAVGVPLAKLAMKVIMGHSLEELGFTSEPLPRGFNVKVSVFPFKSFPGEDPILGPQMRSTGEVMGRDRLFGAAFAKGMLAAGVRLPTRGGLFVSVNDNDKGEAARLAARFAGLGFDLFATSGTAAALESLGVQARLLNKIHEGRPNVLDAIKNGDIQLIINTPLGRHSFYDDSFIRTEAILRDIPCLTTLSAATAALEGIEALREGLFELEPLEQSVRAG